MIEIKSYIGSKNIQTGKNFILASRVGTASPFNANISTKMKAALGNDRLKSFGYARNSTSN